MPESAGRIRRQLANRFNLVPPINVPLRLREHFAAGVPPPHDSGCVCEPFDSPRSDVEPGTGAGRSGGRWRIPGARLPAIRVSE